MITKEQNALIKLVLAMNDPKPEKQRKTTVNDKRIEAKKYVRFLLDKKNLC